MSFLLPSLSTVGSAVRGKMKHSCCCSQQHVVPVGQDSTGCVGALLYAALIHNLSLPTLAELSRSVLHLYARTTWKAFVDSRLTTTNVWENFETT